jgi:hypothetical protein
MKVIETAKIIAARISLLFWLVLSFMSRAFAMLRAIPPYVDFLSLSEKKSTRCPVR